MNQSSFHQTPQERLGRADPVLAEILSAEADHQRTHIRLIPSENYLHPDVAFTLTSSFGNKYSEGYPHKWRSGELIHEDALLSGPSGHEPACSLTKSRAR